MCLTCKLFRMKWRSVPHTTIIITTPFHQLTIYIYIPNECEKKNVIKIWLIVLYLFAFNYKFSFIFCVCSSCTFFFCSYYSPFPILHVKLEVKTEISSNRTVTRKNYNLQQYGWQCKFWSWSLHFGFLFLITN